MLTNEVVYQKLKSKQVKEILGAKDHPWIVMAHKLCFIPKQYDLDSNVPWCASGMVLETIGEGLRRNAGRVIQYLKSKGHSTDFILEICKEYGVEYTLRDNGMDVELPKLSAAAYDWVYNGVPVALADARKGDWVIFVRRNKFGKKVGNHIACLDEDKMGRILMRVVGCNQSNMICSSNSYLRASLIAVRRARI